MKLQLFSSDNLRNMIRLFITSVLSLLLFLFLLPLSSEYLLKGTYESRYTNENIRVDVSLQSSKPDSLRIISKNNAQKVGWDKSGNTMVVQDKIKSKWQKYTIRAQAAKSGEIQIKLLGPDKKVDNKRYPVLVDFRSLRINGKLIFDRQQAHWHDDRFIYKLKVKENEVVDINFEARSHHFRFNDVTKIYKANLWILCSIVLLSFFISWKLVSYIAKFKKEGNISAVDIVFVCVFFGLLFIPMSNINTAEKSEQENRILAKKPKLLEDTGGGGIIQGVVMIQKNGSMIDSSGETWH